MTYNKWHLESTIDTYVYIYTYNLKTITPIKKMKKSTTSKSFLLCTFLKPSPVTCPIPRHLLVCLLSLQLSLHLIPYIYIYMEQFSICSLARLLSLHLMTWRLTHFVCMPWTFLFNAEQCSIVWIHHSLFILFPIGCTSRLFLGFGCHRKSCYEHLYTCHPVHIYFNSPQLTNQEWGGWLIWQAYV